MKAIIGLWGSANMGKTQTLEALMNKLYEQTGETDKMIDVVANDDKYRCIVYKDKRICIATGGDNGDIVEANCEKFKRDDYDIAVSATRSKGSSVDALNEFAKGESLKVKWLSKSYSDFGKDYERKLIDVHAQILFEYISEIILT